jgi:hypothetical protein
MGIDVSHLDSHMGTMQIDSAYHLAYVRLAAELGVPVRMADREALCAAGLDAVVTEAGRLGVVSPDFLILGGPPEPSRTAEHWESVLRRLRPGVTEIYVHAGRPGAEGEALTGRWAQRVADHDFFSSNRFRALLSELDIRSTGYRALREVQRGQRTWGPSSSPSSS